MPAKKKRYVPKPKGTPKVPNRKRGKTVPKKGPRPPAPDNPRY